MPCFSAWQAAFAVSVGGSAACAAAAGAAASSTRDCGRNDVSAHSVGPSSGTCKMPMNVTMPETQIAAAEVGRKRHGANLAARCRVS